MDPTTDAGELNVITGLDIRAFDVIGWDIKLDRFEVNDTRAQATDLGSEITTIERDLSIHSADDEDWFRIKAHHTGLLSIDAKFLHAIGNLNIGVYDASGDLIVDSTDTKDNEQLSIPVVGQQTYYVRVFGVGNAINNYSLEIENFAAPSPTGAMLDPDSDSGRSNSDRITNKPQPEIFVQADLLQFVDQDQDDVVDANEVDILTAAQLVARNAAGLGVQVVLTNISTGEVVNGFATPSFADPVNANSPYAYRFIPAAPLSDGTYILTAATRVIDGQTPRVSARTQLSAPLLQFTIDTAAPPVPVLLSFDPPGSDSGVPGVPATLVDRITNATAVGFSGTAEMNALLRLSIDNTANDAKDFASQASTVAIPTDGNQDDGFWRTPVPIDLNNPSFGARDGVREVHVTAEDLAGNVSGSHIFTLFVDTQGPQVYDPAGDIGAIFVPDNPATTLNESLHNLYKPGGANGPTPAVNQLSINIRDLAARATGFLHAALEASVATNPGHYRVIGDHGGEVAIAGVTYTPDPAIAGQPATGIITLTFNGPLPDDRYTLVISDNLVDPANNHFDGNTNAMQPGSPSFPSGDGIAGGDFVTRFTVDSRPEVGSFAVGAVTVDLNGNFTFDGIGTAQDAANADVVFQIGTISDHVFAGKFEPANLAADNDGFDKLGVYGYDNVAREYRFLLDLDHDGVFDLRIRSGFQINAIPVAGDFSPAHPGDEIGLFDGQAWYLDTNGDNLLQPGVDTVIYTAMRGLPLVGNFDGVAGDDLATYDAAKNTFHLDYGRDGFQDATVAFTSSGGTGPDNGFNDRPFAGDYNLDGIDDLGIWLPNNPGNPSSTVGHWYLMVSDAGPVRFKSFAPAPLGNDIFGQFGDTFTLPVFGNFDPPLESSTPAVEGLLRNNVNPHDVNGDGRVTPLDALLVINALNAGSFQSPADSLLYFDVSGDNAFSPLDAVLIINRLNAGDPVAQAAGESANTVAPPLMSATPVVGEDAPSVDPRVLDWLFATDDDDDEKLSDEAVEDIAYAWRS